MKLTIGVFSVLVLIASSMRATVLLKSIHRRMGLHMSAGESVVSWKVGFMFPGQGAQAVGMAGPLCSELPQAKALFDKASIILG